PEGEAELLVSELRATLRKSLPDYMLPSAFVFLTAFPRTLSGKVDRRALPAPARTQADGPAETLRNPVEEVLAGFWCEVLGLDGIAVEDDFFELGGHSLLGSRVLARVRNAFGVELPLSALFARPTLGGLALAIEDTRRQSLGLAAPPLRPAPRESRLPLSFAQQSLWFVDQAFPALTAYNIPAAFRLEGALDEAILEAALNEIVRRHEALRTRLEHDSDGPYQTVDPALPLPLPRTDLASTPRPEEE